MRKMVYRRADGQVVNTMAEAGEKYTIEMINIKPFDEVEALEKFRKEEPQRRAERFKKASRNTVLKIREIYARNNWER